MFAKNINFLAIQLEVACLNQQCALWADSKDLGAHQSTSEHLRAHPSTSEHIIAHNSTSQLAHHSKSQLAHPSTSQHIRAHYSTSEHIRAHQSTSEHIGAHQSTSEHKSQTLVCFDFFLFKKDGSTKYEPTILCKNMGVTSKMEAA